MLSPLPRESWNYDAAAHLLSRAGFGGTPDEIHRCASLTHEAAISQLLDFDTIPNDTAPPEWAKPDPQRVEKLRAARMAAPEERRRLQREEQQAQRRHLIELRGWWLDQMLTGPRPLREKMVLFWHGHFATSIEKVRDVFLMWRQNQLFRKLATGNWLTLLVAVGKDPAMLIWLDQAQSRKEHPNENFARELMELFTLGEGHYSEKDVTEAARALTGWSYDRLGQEFVERPNWHDNGEKLIFGNRGNYDAEALLKLIVAQPQAARFISARLWRFFAGSEPAPELETALASEFRSAGYEFKPLLRMMFLSEEFYSPSITGNHVKSPVEWLVGSAKLLGRPLPGPLVSSGITRALGQELFAPPNVKGWDGGLSWINTNSMLTRYNQTRTLVFGDSAAMRSLAVGNKSNPRLTRTVQDRRPVVVDVDQLFSYEDRSTPEAFLRALQKRFLLSPLKPKQERTMREFLKDNSDLSPNVLLNAIQLVMCTPEYQLS